jgi:hypothetical protein
MRLDPKGTVAGHPSLLVRRTLRRLGIRVEWGLGEIESAAALEAGEGRGLIKGLLAEGLIEVAGRGRWTLTTAGQALSSASAAKRVTRATAEMALARFLSRVQMVNTDPYFLGKVTRVVLFGSMLKSEVDRLSDVDLAVELAPKEPDLERARFENYARVEALARQGHRFENFLKQEGCWYWETFGFLKGQDRVISLADYKQESEFVLAVPHRILLGDSDQAPVVPEPAAARPKLARRPQCCPF